MFLKGVLFKPKPVIATTTKGPVSGKKRKKKVDSAEKGGGGETLKKKKKSNSKSSASRQETNISEALLPLDVSISSVSSVPLVGSHGGLLTTGSVSTSILVTQLKSESLTNLTTSTLLQQTITSGDVIVSTSKETGKRNSTKEPKEKVKRSKSTKKSSKNTNPAGGSPKVSSTMTSHTNKTNAQVAFQRVPAGSFVLSGASGQIRLQGGANILYVQQATSGATQLLSSPAINASSGAFTAVISSNLATNPPKINIIPSSNFKLGSLSATTSSSQTKGLSAVISSGGCGNLVINSTASPVGLNTPSVVDTSPCKNVHVLASSIATTYSVSASSVASSTSTSTATTTASSTIMTHLSANDLRYLASLIAKHSNSRPNSPMPSPISGPLVLRSDDKTLLKTARESSDAQKCAGLSTTNSEGTSGSNKSSLISILDKKGGIMNNPIQTSKKIVQPPSLAQRVASIQQKDSTAKMKAQRLKTSKLVSTTVNMPMGHIITANSTKNSTTMPPASKTPQSKAPVSLTIPISRLPSSINFSPTSALSKSIINVPVLSSYLTQEKLIATLTKPSSGLSPSSRTIVTSSSTQAKKSPVMMSGGIIPVCSGQVRMSNMTAFESSRTPTSTSTLSLSSSVRSNSSGILISKTPFTTAMSSFKSPVKCRTASPISLQLPSQALLKDPKVLRKAVSDVKVVSVMSQHQSKAQFPSLASLSTLRSISNPSSPLRSPTNDDESVSDELSRSQSRNSFDELKSLDDRKRNSFNPMKSSIMAAIGEKSLSPSTLPSTSLLTASSSREMNIIGRRSITGKVATGPFFGKLFVGPKSIVDPARGKVTLSTDPNATIAVNSFVIESEPYDEDDDDDDDDEDESDVDFAISSPGMIDSPSKSTASVQKNIEPVKHSNITKIVYAPNTSGEIKTNNSATTASTPAFSKSVLDIARAKLQGHDSTFRSSGNVNIVTDPKTRLEDHPSPSILGSDSKLRFEPLKVSSARAKFTSVISMRDAAVASSLETSKSNRQIIISTTSKHFTSLASSTSSGPITNITISPDINRAQITTGVHKFDMNRKPTKTNGTTLHELRDHSVMSGDGLVKPPNSFSFKGTCFSSPKNGGITSLNIDSKGTVLGNIEVRGGVVATDVRSSPLRVTATTTNYSPTVACIEKLEKTSSSDHVDEASSSSSPVVELTELSKTPQKSSLKSAKQQAQQQECNMIVEEEPQPYITRSGRLMKSKYSIQYIDELDRKKTPKKRRLSSSTNQDNSPSSKKNKVGMSESTPPTSAVTLENLVEAAKLITKESDTLMNSTNVTESVVDHSSIDATTNIAATAMLELLSCDNSLTKNIMSSEEIDHPDVSEQFSSNGILHSANIAIDPRLPSLAPILKVPSDFEHMSNDTDDSVADDNVFTESALRRASFSPIPPLAAIQDKCAEKDMNISIESLDTKIRHEVGDDISFTENKPEINTLPVKQILSCLVIMESDNVETNQITENLPILAAIQDKPENVILKDQTRVVSPQTVMSAETTNNCGSVITADVLGDEAVRNLVQIQATNVDLITPEKRSGARRSQSPGSPSSSPPALAMIQNNSISLPAPNFNDSMLGENCTVNLTDIALASSLPPLAAIQVNANDTEIASSNDTNEVQTDVQSSSIDDDPNPCTISVGGEQS